MATVVQRSAADRELIDRAEDGDREAFAALYRRHFQGLYDFALRIVRDDDLAADVVQSTFVKAWDAARKQKEVGNVKAWLYTIAHNLAIDELRLRKRLVEPSAGGRGEDGGFPFAVVDPSRLSDPETVVQDRELVELVWDSASALNPQEYALLDLHLRRGLDADEISRHLSLAKSAVYTRLSRLRDSLEEAVTSTLLMRRGRRECLDLDWLLEELRATEATQPVRRAIKQHLAACERCQESKRRLVSPAEIFAGISLVPVALELQSEVWESVTSHLALAPAAAAANGAGTANATPVDAAANGAGAEVVAPVDAGLSSLLSAKGVAVSALATGAAVVTATTLVFTGGGEKIEDPDDVHSTTHVVGRSSTENVVRMAWSRVEDADAYSVSWSRGSALPDRTADLDGNATGANSPRLAPGRWYFNLRTRGDGDWTSTVHVGPFVIAPERELSVTWRVEPRRSPKAKPRLKPKRAVEPSTPSSAAYRSPVVDHSRAPESSPAADSSPVVGVARVVGKQQPQESDDKTDEKPPPKRPSPQRSSVPVVESTSPPPPPPAEPLSSPPPASADDAGEDGDEEREDDEPEQQQPAEQEPAEQQQPEDDERKDEEPPDEKKQKDGEDARGEKKGKGDGERP